MAKMSGRLKVFEQVAHWKAPAPSLCIASLCCRRLAGYRKLRPQGRQTVSLSRLGFSTSWTRLWCSVRVDFRLNDLEQSGQRCSRTPVCTSLCRSRSEG
ncbi:hypothetical protein TYRP_015405 [Tyrophagus putrescentiae]|nr:hypothetical protein TYRP_015405 [Tyrophagus putrescentiae]